MGSVHESHLAAHASSMCWARIAGHSARVCGGRRITTGVARSTRSRQSFHVLKFSAWSLPTTSRSGPFITPPSACMRCTSRTVSMVKLAPSRSISMGSTTVSAIPSNASVHMAMRSAALAFGPSARCGLCLAGITRSCFALRIASAPCAISTWRRCGGSNEPPNTMMGRSGAAWTLGASVSIMGSRTLEQISRPRARTRARAARRPSPGSSAHRAG